MYVTGLLILLTTHSILLNVGCNVYYDILQGIERDKITIYEYTPVVTGPDNRIVPYLSKEFQNPEREPTRNVKSN
jgi:hypothetical protein